MFRPTFRIVVNALCGSLLLAGFAQLDILGATSAAALRSEASFMRLFSGPWYRSAAQDRVTVVLIDDQYLKAVDASWPLSYAQQELLLEDIASHAPAAMFLDVLHLHRHDGSERTDRALGQLVDRVEAISSSEGNLHLPRLVRDLPGVPTCLETPADDQLGSGGTIVEAEITERLLRAGATDVYIGWTGCGTRYPAYVLGDPARPTPAFALYTAVCEHDATESVGATLPGCNARARALSEGMSDGSLFFDRMAVQWGTGASAANARTYAETAATDCVHFDGPDRLRRTAFSLRQLAMAFWDALSGRSARGVTVACPYIDTVPATLLLNPTADTRQRLSELLSARAVLIGTRIEATSDITISPVNGQVPGVYKLAMATENYLHYGPNYVRDLPRASAFLLEVATLFATLTVIALLWRSRSLKRGCRRFSERLTPRRLAGIAPQLDCGALLLFKFMLPILLSLAAAGIAWRAGGAPFNWIAIAVLSFVANPVSLADCNGGRRPEPYQLIERWFTHRRERQ